MKSLQPVPRLAPSSRHRPPTGRRTTQRGAQQGVALLEVLISILLFSFGLLGLIGLEATAINVSVDAEDRSRAALFANDMASYMWGTNSVTVPSSQLATWNSNCANLSTETGLPSCVVSVTPTAGTTNSADIKITWVPIHENKTTSVRQFTTRVILP
jgi:type IV pilus assembly protein PilV